MTPINRNQCLIGVNRGYNPAAFDHHSKRSRDEDCERRGAGTVHRDRGRLRRRGNAARVRPRKHACRHTRAAPPANRVFFVTPANGATIKPMSTIEFGSSGVTVAAVPPGELKPEQVRAGTIHYHIAVDSDCLAGRHRDPEGRPVGPLWRRQEGDRNVARTGRASSHRAGGRRHAPDDRGPLRDDQRDGGSVADVWAPRVRGVAHRQVVTDSGGPTIRSDPFPVYRARVRRC